MPIKKLIGRLFGNAKSLSCYLHAFAFHLGRGNVNQQFVEVGNKSNFCFKRLRSKKIHSISVQLSDLKKGKFEASVFENSIVVVNLTNADEIEDERVLQFLRIASYRAEYLVLSIVPDEKLLSIPFSLTRFLTSHGLKNGFTGSHILGSKEYLVYLGGRCNGFENDEVPRIKILAILPTFNDEAIIETVVRDLLEQGLDVHIIDNWSHDSTYNIVNQLAQRGRITFERFPASGPTNQFPHLELLNRKIEIAKQTNYDWIYHTDSDQVVRSPWLQYNLAEAVSRVDYYGYNCIDHTLLNFRPVVDSNSSRPVNPLVNMMHFEWGNKRGHFLQQKLWKVYSDREYDLATSGGHEIQFEGKRIFPLNFLVKHYQYLSFDHMKEKLIGNRRDRTENERETLGWHEHIISDIELLNNRGRALWSEDQLLYFDGQHFYSDYLLERLATIGLPNPVMKQWNPFL